MKHMLFSDVDVARFIFGLWKSPTKVKSGGEKTLTSRKLRLEALETRELLAVDVITGAAVATDDASFSELVDVYTSTDDSVMVDLSDEATSSEVETVDISVEQDDVVTTASAKTWTIDSTSDSDTTSTTLRYAINNASTGDKIVFASSMNGKTITLSGKEN